MSCFSRSTLQPNPSVLTSTAILLTLRPIRGSPIASLRFGEYSMRLMRNTGGGGTDEQTAEFHFVQSHQPSSESHLPKLSPPPTHIYVLTETRVNVGDRSKVLCYMAHCVAFMSRHQSQPPKTFAPCETALHFPLPKGSKFEYWSS